MWSGSEVGVMGSGLSSLVLVVLRGLLGVRLELESVSVSLSLSLWAG